MPSFNFIELLVTELVREEVYVWDGPRTEDFVNTYD